MQKDIETEYKFIVSEDQFIDILNRFSIKYPEGEFKVQINYYYDTYNNLLNKNNITVRVRQDHDKLIWQIKRHKEGRNSLFLNDEYSGDLDVLPRNVKVNNINEDLILKGNLVTERKELCFGTDSKICFDISMYLGHVDYEIEIEYLPVDKKIVSTLIEDIGLRSFSSASKSSRFFRRLEELEDGKKTTSLC